VRLVILSRRCASRHSAAHPVSRGTSLDVSPCGLNMTRARTLVFQLSEIDVQKQKEAFGASFLQLKTID
jgi:hypothetical protein